MPVRNFWRIFANLRKSNIWAAASVWLLLCGFLLVPYNSCAQKPTSYKPLENDITLQEEVKSDLIAQHEQALDQIEKKEVKAFYEKRHQVILDGFEEETYLFDPSIYPIAQKVLQDILLANSCFEGKKIRLLVARSSIPNAACYGEGTLVINLGLLSRLENKAQLAFVIAHELAHQHMDHVNGDFLRRVEYLESDEFKEEVKSIKKSEYNRLARVETLTMNYTFSNRKHSRKHEAEADSIAVEFLKNTAYDPSAALKALDILDHIDEEKYPNAVAFEQLFNYPDYPWDPYWLEEESVFGVKQKVDQELQDSLKTHPDCQKRIELLKTHFQLAFPALEADRQFKGVALVSDFEIVQYALVSKRLGLCLYRTLILQETHPKNAYLQAAIAICLYRICQEQEAHQLGMNVGMPDAEQPENYRKTLQFIQNLRIKEIKALVNQQARRCYKEFGDDEHVLYANHLAYWVTEKFDKAYELYNTYRLQYPDGLYVDQFEKP